MSVLGPVEVMIIAALVFHLILISRLGWRGYLWCRLVAAVLVVGQPALWLRLAAVGLLLEPWIRGRYRHFVSGEAAPGN